MLTGVLFVVHQRARGEEAEDEAGVQTGDAVDKSFLDHVVSLRVHLVMLPWINRARADLVFIFNFLPYLPGIALSLSKKNKCSTHSLCALCSLAISVDNCKTTVVLWSLG